MLKRMFTWFVLLLLLGLAVVAGWRAYQDREADTGSTDTLALLIEDGVPLTDTSVRTWIDAAQEEGLHLQPVHAFEFLRPAFIKRSKYAGIVLPDAIHRKMSKVLIDTLVEYVQKGGKLMLVFDAGSLNVKGLAVPGRSRLSALAGVEYALYKELGDNTLVNGPAISTPAILTDLNFPPGKYQPVPPELGTRELLKLRRAAGLDLTNESLISSYDYESLEYGHFVTRGSLVGKPLMVADSGDLLAGVHKVGKGEVLFVNLPLTYLKMRTDAAPMHGFLHYFGRTMLQLPSMGSVPDGIGGLVMNWHVDSGHALKSIAVMNALGFFEQGPYSVHITAGPDTNQFGDKIGLDVNNREEAQKLIKMFVARGDEVGSHGGWIHNYFGKNLSDHNEKDFAKYLTLNNEAISKASGRPVLEYSAPEGNHPVWVTRWLEEHGVYAHYYTGNVGLGPTRSYVNGDRLGKRTWTFPVSVYGTIASFEEAAMRSLANREAPITQESMGNWLKDMSNFARDRALIRMVYFHPPGVASYQDAARMWITHTKQLLENGDFRWYTMKRVADFLDRREQVDWKVTSAGAGRLLFSATHQQTLSEQSWRFPKARYARPVVDVGEAKVRETLAEWVLVGGNGNQIRAHINIHQKESRNEK